MLGLGKPKTVVAVDLGEYSVKVLEVDLVGQNLHILNYGIEKVGEHESPEEALSRLMQGGGFKSKKCISAVSGRSVIVRYVPMQVVPDSQLKDSALYEADKYIPFDISEVVLDCQRLEDPQNEKVQKEGSMKVMLVAVKSSYVNDHASLMSRAGLSPIIIDYDSFALGNAFELWAKTNNHFSESKNIALLDVGGSKSNINIMRGDTSFFTREIYMGGRNITESIAKRFGEDPSDIEKMKLDPKEAEDSMRSAFNPVLEEICSEVRMSFDYYENQVGGKVDQLYLSGGTARFPGLEGVFEQILQIPTATWNPFDGIEKSSGVNVDELNQMAFNFVIAMGLATRFQP